MEEEISAFYVVQKGDIIGVYRTLKDCQFQVSDPSVSVYKGYSMRKETEEYLRSTGLKNAMYTINSKDVTCDLFGALQSCNNQVHVSSSLERDVLVASTSSILVSERPPYESSVPIPLKLDGPISFSGIETSKQKRPEKASESDCKMQLDGLSSYFGKSSGETLKRNKVEEAIKLNFRMASCLLEFDGASKGNPGKGGAGAILRSEDGKVICRLSEGLGIVTNNFAEYKAVILGMKYALKKGYECIQVQGDSMLVCMQIQNKWQTKHANIMELSKEAKELKERFRSFEINHVRRELNTEADTLANMAVNLESGVVQEG